MPRRGKGDVPPAGPVLTGFESEVLSAVRRIGNAGAAEVRSALAEGGHPHPYTTVASALQRLHRRGLLRRDRERVQGGLRYTFRATDGDEGFYESFLDRITEAFGEGAYVRLFDAMGRPSDEDIERLRKRVEGGS